MKLLLTSAGLETDGIKTCFLNMIAKDMSTVHALFIPIAAIDPGAIAVLPKCMNDLLKCGIPETNISVFDLHRNMTYDEILQYDLVYLCGGNTNYLLRRMNETGFSRTLLSFIQADKAVLGVSAGSLIFANNLAHNLGILPARLEVHCATGENPGAVTFPLKETLRLTNTCGLVIRDPQGDMEIISF